MRITLFCIFSMALFLLSGDIEAAMYSYVDQYGRVHFTNVPADPRYQKLPGFAAVRKTSVYGRYAGIIRSAANRYSLDPELIRAIIQVESSFNPYAVSEKGAMGLMQLMPDTAREMEVYAPFEAEENIMGGSRYLRKLLDIFDDNLEQSLAAYNAGPNRVLADGAVPKIPETEQYVNKVLQEYGRTKTGIIAGQ